MAAQELTSLSRRSWLLIIEEWAPCWNAIPVACAWKFTMFITGVGRSGFSRAESTSIMLCGVISTFDVRR